MIPPKFLVMPPYEASSSNNKVVSNFESKHNNLIVQLVCPDGLPTFIPLATLDLFEIQVLANEKDEPLLKKYKKNYDASHKCRNIWTT